MSEGGPNILFVMADQLSASALPCHGGPAITPQLDRLAAEGVVFERAYCNSPLCAPSRASMLTGELPSAIGVYDNAAELPASVPTVAHHLRGLGYETCLAGKMHFIGPDQLHGFEERLTTDVYPAGLDWVPDWTLPPSQRLPWYHDMSSVLEAGISEATLQLDFDEEVGFRSVRKLFDLARAPERPFFFAVSFTHPHDPYEPPSRFWDLYEEHPVPPPAIPTAEPDPYSRRILEMCGTEPGELDPELVDRARRAYHASVSYVDEKLGALVAALETTGLADNTVVVVSSDHGDMLGERGLWYKMTFFEDSARVPLIVHAPGRYRAARIGAPVSLLDLLPTFVELAGGEAPATRGASLLPLLGGERQARTPVLAEYLAEGTQSPCVMVRHGAHKLVRCPGDPDLLFDLDADPHELENLAGSTEAHTRLGAIADETWDLDALRRAVLASQRQRLLVSDALALGAQSPWDYEPPAGEASGYVRGRNFWEPFGRARLRP
jgi:choline-sulfatase